MAEMSQERTATDKHHFSTIPAAIVHGPLLHARAFAVNTADIPPDHFDILHERSSLIPLIWLVNCSLRWHAVLTRPI